MGWRILTAAMAVAFVASATMAQTHTVTRVFTGPNGLEGTAVLVLTDASRADGTYGNPRTVPPELVSAELTFNRLPGGKSTRFSREQLAGFHYVRRGGVVLDFNFWGSNVEGYSLQATGPFQTTLRGPEGFEAAGVGNTGETPPPL